MRKFYSFLIGVFFVSIVVTMADGYSGNQTGNMKIIDDMSSKTALVLLQKLKDKKSDTIYVPIALIEANRYFNSFVVKYADSFGIRVMIAEKGDGKKPFLDLMVDIRTVYANYDESSDSLLRTITLDVRGEFISEESELRPPDIISHKWNDVISREEAVQYNLTAYRFAQHQIPEPPKTFWSEIVQPVAFIGTAIITVVLLFTVRSK
jgi:hypothetical protein